jgi:prevent-host-death family protein
MSNDIPKQQPVTEAMNISAVKQQFNSLVNRVYRNETRILIEKSGIPVAAVVSADDLTRLNQLDRDWDEGTQAIERFGAAFADVPPDEVEAEIARIISEIREQNQEKAERQSA